VFGSSTKAASAKGHTTMIWSPPPAFSIQKIEMTKALPPALSTTVGDIQVTARIAGLTADDPAILLLVSKDTLATDLLRALARESAHEPSEGILHGENLRASDNSTLECNVDTSLAKESAYHVAVVQFRSHGGEVALSDETFRIS
jgi:hypothetical protein